MLKILTVLSLIVARLLALNCPTACPISQFSTDLARLTWNDREATDR
jgi:hypothetical protein